MPRTIEIKTLFFSNSINKAVDDWASKNDFTRHHAAQQIISAATGKQTKVSFNSSNIIAHLPMRYVNELRKKGMKDDDTLIKHSIIMGLSKLSLPA